MLFLLCLLWQQRHGISCMRTRLYCSHERKERGCRSCPANTRHWLSVGGHWSFVGGQVTRNQIRHLLMIPEYGGEPTEICRDHKPGGQISFERRRSGYRDSIGSHSNNIIGIRGDHYQTLLQSGCGMAWPRLREEQRNLCC